VSAIRKNKLKLAEKLINEGFCNPERVLNASRLTPLHVASTVYDENFLKLLISTYPNFIDRTDFKGNTPLHYAAYHRNIKFIEILLENGAAVNVKNDNRLTPLHLA
jgi:ankyrin repeat protein